MNELFYFWVPLVAVFVLLTYILFSKNDEIKPVLAALIVSLFIMCLLALKDLQCDLEACQKAKAGPEYEKLENVYRLKDRK